MGATTATLNRPFAQASPVELREAIVPGGNVRTLVFGPGGEGLVFYLILEDQRRVDVLEVQWLVERWCWSRSLA